MSLICFNKEKYHPGANLIFVCKEFSGFMSNWSKLDLIFNQRNIQCNGFHIKSYRSRVPCSQVHYHQYTV